MREGLEAAIKPPALYGWELISGLEKNRIKALIELGREITPGSWGRSI
jgi:hypothetical protein